MIPKDKNRAYCKISELPRYIKNSYARLFLVSRREHLTPGITDEDDTLIVSSDWLLWQQLIAEGRHSVYFEHGLLNWVPNKDLDHNLFIHAHDWIYENGDDNTFFRGVSLARSFGGEISMALMNIYRLDRSIRTLIKDFQPQEILYVDFINEISLIDPSLRRSIVASAARDYQVKLTFLNDEAEAKTTRIAENVVTPSKRSLANHVALFVYTRTLEISTKFRCLLSPRTPRALLLLNSNFAAPLVNAFSGNRLTLVFLGQTMPKKISLIWQCLRKGILLVTPPNDPISDEDEGVLRGIEEALKRTLAKCGGNGRFVRAYVHDQIVATGRLRERAREVRNAERLLDRHKPERLVVDGLRNSPHRHYIELAKSRGIEVNYIWHSPLTPQNQKMDALGGDPRIESLVDRNFSWGRINDQWLDWVGSKQPRIRIGSPLIGHYRKKAGPGPAADMPPPSERNVLVLQYTPIVTDIRGLNSNIYAHFIDTVRLLRERGYKNIRLKLHPGRGRWKKSYFETIASHFGLRCKILKSEPFVECMKWADLVIGPAQTGAFFETLAAGKPYYPVLLEPHGLDSSYYVDYYPIFDSIKAAVEALDEAPPPDGQALLDAVWGTDTIKNTPLEFLKALEGSPTNAGPTGNQAL